MTHCECSERHCRHCIGDESADVTRVHAVSLEWQHKTLKVNSNSGQEQHITPNRPITLTTNKRRAGRQVSSRASQKEEQVTTSGTAQHSAFVRFVRSSASFVRSLRSFTSLIKSLRFVRCRSFVGHHRDVTSRCGWECYGDEPTLRCRWVVAWVVVVCS